MAKNANRNATSDSVNRASKHASMHLSQAAGTGRSRSASAAPAASRTEPLPAPPTRSPSVPHRRCPSGHVIASKSTPCTLPAAATASKKDRLSRSRLARPYIWRLMVLSRLIHPLNLAVASGERHRGADGIVAQRRSFCKPLQCRHSAVLRPLRPEIEAFRLAPVHERGELLCKLHGCCQRRTGHA